MTRIPPPPVNVTVLDMDGEEHPCVVSFDGWSDETGHALWTARPAGHPGDWPDPFSLTSVWRADSVPPNTLLRVSTNPPETP